MPDKSIREMSTAERRHHSLAARVFHATLFGSIALGLVTLLVGAGLYSYSLVNAYTNDAFGVSTIAGEIIARDTGAADLAEEVMSVYRGMSAEEREQTGTAVYRERFSHVSGSEKLAPLLFLLHSFRRSDDVYDVYLGMYDLENSALVYIADPDENPDTSFSPGEWERVEREEAERFLNWNGEGVLYDLSKTEQYGWMCTAGIPLRNEAGEIAAFVLTDVVLENVTAGMKAFILQFTCALLLMTAAVAVIQARRMKKAVVKPINEIAEAAQDYVRDKRKGETVTEHFSMLNIRTGDEIENLSLVMADMERDLSEVEENLTAAVAEKERIGTELSMAAAIQAHLLPSVFPPFPERDEFTIFASMTPAKEVGGDLYDFFMVDEDHLAMVVADVSGKGVPAALFSMIAKALLKTHAQMQLSPRRVLEDVNASLSENNEENMFVTVWLGILEISTGRLTYADAGHEKLLLYQDGVWQFLPKEVTLALAVLSPEELDIMGKKSSFRDHTIRLNPGDAILQYTDGVTEAMNADKALFGSERLLAALNSAPSPQPEVLLPHLHARIDDFVRDAPQFDDITMLALRMNNRKP